MAWWHCCLTTHLATSNSLTSRDCRIANSRCCHSQPAAPSGPGRPPQFQYVLTPLFSRLYPSFGHDVLPPTPSLAPARPSHPRNQPRAHHLHHSQLASNNRKLHHLPLNFQERQSRQAPQRRRPRSLPMRTSDRLLIVCDRPTAVPRSSSHQQSILQLKSLSRRG